MSYERYKATIKGSTLVMHNGQTADPRNQFSVAMKQISKKRVKADEDYDGMANLEFQAGLYINKDRKVVIPGRVFEAALVNGAKKTKEGKVALACMFVDNDAVLQFEGDTKTLEELAADPKYSLCVAVKIGQAKVMRTRPFFEDWRATFEISIDTSNMAEMQLERWLKDCGTSVGICDWRPRHGRFEIVEFSKS